jgi:hypothetical protein
VFETVTGLVQEVLPYAALTWNTPLTADGKINATLPLTGPDIEHLNVRTLTTPWRYSLAVVQGDQALAAGVINGDRNWSDDNATQITVTAAEPWVLLAMRPLLGDYSTVAPPADVTLTSGSLWGLATEIAGRATNDFPDGTLPIDLPASEYGTNYTRTYAGSDFKDASAALQDLTKVINGPDVVFDPYLADSRRRVRWTMRVGRPTLRQSGDDLVFDYPGSGTLTENEDPSGMASTLLVTAQPQQDTAAGDSTTAEQTTLVARSNNPELIAGGYPAMWAVNSDHTDVSEQSTLDGYATSYGQAAQSPTVLRPFTVRTDDPDHPLGTYRRGDTAQIVVGDHPWIPAGAYPVRITDLAVDSTTVTVTVAETQAGT